MADRVDDEAAEDVAGKIAKIIEATLARELGGEWRAFYMASDGKRAAGKSNLSEAQARSLMDSYFSLSNARGREN
jgi:hypothetical protein